MSNPIPLMDAQRICNEIQKGRKAKLFSQCWGCLRYSKGDAKKMCFYNPPENRGCKLVNKIFDNKL